MIQAFGDLAEAQVSEVGEVDTKPKENESCGLADLNPRKAYLAVHAWLDGVSR